MCISTAKHVCVCACLCVVWIFHITLHETRCRQKYVFCWSRYLFCHFQNLTLAHIIQWTECLNRNPNTHRFFFEYICCISVLMCMEFDLKQFYWFLKEMNERLIRPLKWCRGEFFVSLVLIDKSQSASISPPPPKTTTTTVNTTHFIWNGSQTCSPKMNCQINWKSMYVGPCWACANNEYHDTCRIFLKHNIYWCLLHLYILWIVSNWN